ncbi:WDR78 protein, partial [Chloroceryle aenea]|nr:WDR78 protein [Chloroceryle aenea]
LQVFDDTGKDVTPHPLFHSDPNTAAPRQGKLLESSAHLRATGSGDVSSLPVHQTSGVNGAVSTLDERTEPGSRWDTTGSSSDAQERREERTELTEDVLDRRVDIYLMETETLWIVDMPPSVVSAESEEAGRVRERNRIYAEVCKTRPGNDRFVEKMMQTIKGAAKNKEVQCDKIIVADRGMTVTSWDLYQSFHLSEREPAAKAQSSRATTGTSSSSPATKGHGQTVPISSARGSTTSSTTTSKSAVLTRAHEEEGCRSEAILTSESFQQHLFFMERILMENIFQPKLAVYRQLPVLREPVVPSSTGATAAALEEAEQEEDDKEKEEQEEQKEAFIEPPVLSDTNKATEEISPPRLEELWSYTCDLTNGHSVSSMAWSRVNPDLLAVGYGAFHFKDQKKGLACCWSLKNPRWPERVVWCEHGVTALDFSMASPNLLAVGMYDGSVAICNVRSRDHAACLESGDSSDNLTGPVWQLRWVEQDGDATGDGSRERLLCVSADGRVTEWLVQKRLHCTDLMTIKRTEREKTRLPGGKERKSEALLSRQAAGMCFDFHPKDTNFYLTGTEEGHIHLCSSSCNEQFLRPYRGHKGPVYKVTWNPFSTDMFLSCSADWSIILWHRESQTPILTFNSIAAFVHDIMWSPKSACIFAAVKESRAEIWDLSVSSLNPTISCFASPGVTFTSVLFAQDTDCLLVGNSKGVVGVFELQNLAAPSSRKV